MEDDNIAITVANECVRRKVENNGVPVFQKEKEGGIKYCKWITLDDMAIQGLREDDFLCPHADKSVIVEETSTLKGDVYSLEHKRIVRHPGCSYKKGN